MRPFLALITTVALVLGSGACASASSDSLTLRGLDGEDVAVVPTPDARAVVFLFAATDCPISNYFAPEVGRIHADYAEKGVRFYMAYADEDESLESIRQHRVDFGYRMPALLDFDRVLAERVGATVTPEAIVLLPDGELVYRGRINDLYVAFGKQRPKPTRHDLRLALDAVLAGKTPEVARTEAIGCFIPDPLPTDA